MIPLFISVIEAVTLYQRMSLVLVLRRTVPFSFSNSSFIPVQNQKNAESSGIAYSGIDQSAHEIFTNLLSFRRNSLLILKLFVNYQLTSTSIRAAPSI